MYTTTLAALRGANACQRGYNLIANHVGRDYDGPIALETILDNNGFDDAIWALRAAARAAAYAAAYAAAERKRQADLFRKLVRGAM